MKHLNFVKKLFFCFHRRRDLIAQLHSADVELSQHDDVVVCCLYGGEKTLLQYQRKSSVNKW